MHTKKLTTRERGFSLVELLVVVAVIGILAAVAIPVLSNKNSEVIAAQKQAQNIASIFGGGRAAGAAEFQSANSIDAAMNAVGTGSTSLGTLFVLPGISANMDSGKPLDQQAKTYLTWSDGLLAYNPTGEGSTNSGDGGGQPDPDVGWGSWQSRSAWETESDANGYIAYVEQRWPDTNRQHRVIHDPNDPMASPSRPYIIQDRRRIVD